MINNIMQETQDRNPRQKWSTDIKQGKCSEKIPKDIKIQNVTTEIKHM
jgi:hypothetical protein